MANSGSGAAGASDAITEQQFLLLAKEISVGAIQQAALQVRFWLAGHS